MKRITTASKSVSHPAHLRRTSLVALLVGSWLTLFNQGDVIWAGEMAPGLLVKLALNYLTPFVVANLGLLSKTSEPAEDSEERADG